MKKLFILIILHIVFLTSTFCKADPKNTAKIIGYSGIAYAGSTLIHESGHYLALKGLFSHKVRDVHMRFHPCPGISYWDKGLTTGEKNFIHLSGILFTRSTSEIIDILDIDSGLTSAVYLFTRFDMPYYILNNAVKHFTRSSRRRAIDVHKVVESWTPNKNEQTLIYTSLITAIAIDIYLNRKEIKKHLSRLFH